ncbi:MAG: hypothetical protein O7H41_05040 [Planctomycetota bacterium]|nr:hypothetical protein [Planctomycetota bacterium]
MRISMALFLLPLILPDGISWRHEGLDGLDSAIAVAKKRNGRVLVGLAGSKA